MRNPHQHYRPPPGTRKLLLPVGLPLFTDLPTAAGRRPCDASLGDGQRPSAAEHRPSACWSDHHAAVVLMEWGFVAAATPGIRKQTFAFAIGTIQGCGI